MWLHWDVATPCGQVALHGPATVAPPLFRSRCEQAWLGHDMAWRAGQIAPASFLNMVRYCLDLTIHCYIVYFLLLWASVTFPGNGNVATPKVWN